MLPFGIAARYIGVPFKNGAEEDFGNIQIAAHIDNFTRDLLSVHRQIAVERAQNFGDLRVGVLSLQDVLLFA